MATCRTWDRAVQQIRPVLLLAPQRFLRDLRAYVDQDGIPAAVQGHNSEVLYRRLLRVAQQQGIGDRVALDYADRHGLPSLSDVLSGLRDCRCPRLQSYWTFSDCRYRKARATCARADLIGECIVPCLPARKGSLAQLATSLALFVRDVCGGDLVGWMDGRLAEADIGSDQAERGRAMAEAVVDPFAEVQGVSRKVVSMALADLLLGADAHRERWVTAGASMIAVDRLVHAHLHRTGILRLVDAEHTYGPACYAPGGCAEVIAGLADRVDARAFAPENPVRFPRLVQFALWHFCAEGGWSICNGNRMDDRLGCRQVFCPADRLCVRRPMPIAERAK